MSPLVAPLAAYLLAVNIMTYLAFLVDKRSARAAGRRVPERALLCLAAVGGSPAAFLAQQTLRHKTRKQPFGAWLIIIAALQAAALVVLAYALKP